MNSSLPRIAVGLLLAGTAFSLRAAAQDFLSKVPDPREPVPAPPFLQQDGPLNYTAVLSYRDKPPAAATPRLDEATIDKVQDIRHEVSSWNNRTARAEAWYVGPERFDASTAALGGAPGIRPHPAGGDGARSFPELEWVNASCYAGTIRQGETSIAVFRKAFEGPNQAAFGPFLFAGTEATVYIDQASRLPLAVKTPQYTIAYKYGTPPATLDLPSEYRQAYQNYLVALKNVPLSP